MKSLGRAIMVARDIKVEVAKARNWVDSSIHRKRIFTPEHGIS